VFLRRVSAFLLVLVAAMLVSPGRADVQQLQQSFIQPPDDARIMVRWWWFGPAVTKPQIEREMNLMKQGGIGGFEVQPTYPLALDGERPGLKNLPLGSPEFLDMLKFTAAKAKELGLRMDLTLGSGWPYGGPQFPAAEGAAAVTSQSVNVAAGQRSVALPQVRGTVPLAAFVHVGDKYRELPIKDNSVEIPAEVTGESQVMFVLVRQGIMAVKRPSVNGEGNVVDHYSPTVTDKFIREIAEPAIRACAPNYPYAVFCDSLEINGENWTPTLLEEFKKRRGYDLRPLLPALFVDGGPNTAEIRHDWMQTCTDMLNENFEAKFKALANKYGSRFRIQGYGSPPHAMFSYAYADLAEGEGFQWQTFDESRWAASASHLLGRPVTSTETWTWLKQGVFYATPLDIKAEANLHFLQGVNQLIAHGWPYTAEGAAYPGWSFYAAAVFNEKNPWWIVMPDVTKYLQRISHMMRAGTPANDVLVYLPNSDSWANRDTSINTGVGGRAVAGGGGGRGGGAGASIGGAGGSGNITSSLLAAGYNLDYFDDQLLEMRGKVEGNAIAFGDVKYRAVVLPSVQYIMPNTMKKLDEFARKGGIVIAVGAAPRMAPGYLSTDADQQLVRDVGRRLFAAAQPTGKLIQNASELGAALAAKDLAPDVTLEPANADIGFVHRHTADAEIYFVANTTNQTQNTKARFRVSGKNAEVWDPMNGKITRPAGANLSSVDLKLEPYGSRIVVFSNRSLPVAGAVVSPGSGAAMDLSANWTVKFGSSGPTVEMAVLRSWNDDDATRAFSGVATYSRSFNIDAAALARGAKWSLSLGQAGVAGSGGGRGGNGYRTNLESPVREAAVVYINDTKVGSIWAPPYSLDVTAALKSGSNRIRIEVGNLAINSMAATGYPNYNLQGIRQVYGNRFDPQGLQNLQPMWSGLVGPIRLEAAAAR
jgi:hypothetical protein